MAVGARGTSAEQNDLDGGPYAGRLDLDRVVAAGNSCGGVTTIALTASDPRVTAAFVLSGSGTLPGTPIEEAQAVMREVAVPVAYTVGGPEDISRTFAGQDYESLPDDVAAYLASGAEGDHVTVSTTEAILVDEVAGIGINWFDLSPYGTESAIDALLDDPCPSCEPDTWSTEGKHLDSLVA